MRVILASLAVSILLAGCSTFGAPPVPGSVYLARNNLRVLTLAQPGTLEVGARGATGGPDYFCAAGDYAFTKLSVSAADRIVVTRPAGRGGEINPGGNSVGFAVLPQGEADRSFWSVTVSVRRAGENLSVGHALALCDRSWPGVFTD